ncbi:MAG: hypothetical protein U0228_23570 [Myxococcaceae bacterium]
MAYTCPKCGGPVQRGTHSGAAAVGGVVGAMLGAAFASFECPKDGVIERASFPPEVRSQMTRNSVLLGVGALVVLVAAIGLLVAINS